MLHFSKIRIVVACLIVFLPMHASAATITLDATPSRIGTGDLIRVSIRLDSAAAVNAFSGTLVYSHLEPVAVSDGNSIVSLWVTRPVIAASSPIVFAGITPGGFSGTGGVLYSVVFRATKAGSATVTLKDIEILRNDGAGTRDQVTLRPLVLTVSSESRGGYVEPQDMTPPEPFSSSLGTDEQLFDGRAYLVFSAVDKGTGIDHYDVAESRVPSFLTTLVPLAWASSTSPYELRNQSRTSTLYIRAVDSAGNARLSVYPPRQLFTVYEYIVFIVILISVAFLYGRRR